jgi:N-acetylated-alpha-linked acidic dipeptidase
MDLYGDPGFLYHAAAAKFWGLMAMRLANADVLPLRYSTYARDNQADLDTRRRDAIRRSRTPATGNGTPPIAPAFGELLQSLDVLRAAGESADRAADAALAGDANAMRRINEQLMQVERAFLDAKGLPGRPWFRHLLIGPGLTTGYAPWPFPALQQAIEERDANMFSTEAARVVRALRAGAAAAPN